ncbi:MAG: EcsC family protein [Gammaproteobacteria bacterium]|nr:EcsC family protein [Gammaproteobacteria bacterium]
MSETANKNRKSSATTSLPMTFEAEDLDALRSAYFTLEHPSLAARLSGVIGTPIDMAIHLLPKSWYKSFHQAAERAIGKALEVAVSAMRRRQDFSENEIYFKMLIAGTGGLGGFFGLPGLLIELPVSTTVMIRGIAEIAREEGEDIHTAEAQMACIQVFALGGKVESDDAAETGYYGIRLALSGYMSAAIAHVTKQGFSADSGPVVLRLLNAVASRFGVTVSQRAAAQILPVVGAVGAAAVNTIFMQHFQSMARAHFTVRRLERKYGEAFVRAHYKSFE